MMVCGGGRYAVMVQTAQSAEIRNRTLARPFGARKPMKSLGGGSPPVSVKPPYDTFHN